MRTLDTIQLNRQKLNFQSHPKPKKQFVCLYGKTKLTAKVPMYTHLLAGDFINRLISNEKRVFNSCRPKDYA